MSGRMFLYLIRHAIAMDREDWSQHDDLRPLTEEGIERMRRVARGLRAAGADLDQIVSSPLVRAEQTARIVQAAYKLPKVEFSDLLRSEADPEALPVYLARLRDDGSVALVGHEPHISSLLGYLLTARPEPLGPFKKGAVACVETGRTVRAGQCQLRWFMQPKHLAALAGAT